MHKAKKTRLEEKGWKVGTAQEFLGLSDEEAAYVEIRLRLAAALRKRRQRERLSQTEWAGRIRSSQSRVAKMEAGDPSVSLEPFSLSALPVAIWRGRPPTPRLQRRADTRERFDVSVRFLDGRAGFG